MADSIFHKDFKTMPWWWEWWHPTNELSQDPPLKTDVLVVGAGYGGLSTALELARSGIDVTVLERGDFGVGASTRNGGGVSGGTTMGKKGMLLAAETLAGAAFDLMTSPETVAKAKAEFKKRLGAEGYKPLLEKDQKPPLDYRLPARKAAGGE